MLVQRSMCYKRNNVGFVCASLLTLLGPRTRTTHGILGVYGLYLSHGVLHRDFSRPVVPDDYNLVGTIKISS